MKKNRDYFILDTINHFAVNGLDDEEFEILQDAISKLEKKRDANWKASGERARKIVASWPKWKQDMCRQILAPSKPQKR